MIINFQQTEPATRYHLLTQTVIPRPIAWVLSENSDASINLAPFSFFNAMCSDPPLLALSIGKKPDGELKDTRRNLLDRRDCVVHIAHQQQAVEVTASAASLAYGDSEVKDLALVEFSGCSLPRLADCSVAYHCRFYDVHELGPQQQAIIYLEVLNLYLSDDIVTALDQRYVIDAKAIDPLARLGGASYAGLGEAFSVARPK